MAPRAVRSGTRTRRLGKVSLGGICFERPTSEPAARCSALGGRRGPISHWSARDPGFTEGKLFDFRACFLSLLVPLLLMGCTRWESFDVPRPAPELPSYLRVSAPGQDSIVLVYPFVQRDSLYGRWRGDTLGIPLTAIERLERPRLDGLRTAATVVVGVAAWVTVGLLGGGLE